MMQVSQSGSVAWLWCCLHGSRGGDKVEQSGEREQSRCVKG